MEATHDVKSATKSLSIFVSVDMEGCATLVHWDEVRPSDRAEYRRAQRLMTEEVNAVIAGATEAGAIRVTVNDAHSTMRNLLVAQLDPRAHVVSGRVKPHFMLEGLDPDYDLAFFVGYHGAIGAANAVMGHTYSPRIIYECRLNGAIVSELPINAALAGHWGVPVALVSGDATTVEEAQRVLPWALTVETKKSLGYYSADCRSPAAVQSDLHATAARAVRAWPGAFEPLRLETPILMEIDTCTSAQADALGLIPGAQRTAARSVAFRASDAAAMYRALLGVIYLGRL